MKKAISFILICTYLAAVFQFSLPYLSYFANYTYFSTEACIHKDDPSHVCDGQCQLKKMVKQQQDHEKSTSDHAIQLEKISSSTIFYYETPFSSDFYLNASIFSQRYYKQISSQLYSSPSPPPPRLG
jgi:hypothetical protein